MKFRKALKNFIFSSITLSLAFSVAMGGLSPVYADKSTSEKLEEAKKTEEETEDRLDETEDRLDDLKDTQSELKSNLSDLNSKLENVSDKLGDIEENIRKKEEEISDAGTVLEETEEEAKNQYKFIKARIRTQYEKGKESYLELFFQTSNFSDFLNRAEYISRVNQYDHEMLERYKEKIKDIKAQKAELEKEKTELDSLREDAAAEQNRVKELVDNTRNSITAYAGEISVAEAEALAYEAKLIAARNTVSALKEQLKKEEELARLSEKMKKRSLDEVSIGAGEEDMLAALIQCEAGGEPWAGKVAVGAVVMNRVMSGAFPNTITGVIYQPGQFEPVTSGRFAIVLSQGANAECYKAARAAMNGENNIGECLFFRTIVPGIKGTIIGHHVFYLYWTGKYSGYGTADETLENAKKPEDSDEEGLEEEEYTEEEEQEEEDAPVEEEPEEEQQEENNDEGEEAAEENDA
ncbi:MAG: cell wall hydrolase [Lachnospiraceae bacterium]|nr:cell wall hydrolase [Lachnospiraceae bacterium]